MSDALPTVQTGQTAPPRQNVVWYEVAQDKDGLWQWVLWTPNGRRLARSGVAYERRKDAVTAAKSLAENAAKARFIGQVHEPPRQTRVEVASEEESQ